MLIGKKMSRTATHVLFKPGAEQRRELLTRIKHLNLCVKHRYDKKKLTWMISHLTSIYAAARNIAMSPCKVFPTWIESADTCHEFPDPLIKAHPRLIKASLETYLITLHCRFFFLKDRQERRGQCSILYRQARKQDSCISITSNNIHLN